MNTIIIIASILTIMYGAYLIEIYRYLSEPITVGKHQSKKIFIAIFILGIITTLGLAYILKEMILPPIIFNLIVVTLQILLIIPIFGAIIPDQIATNAYNKRLAKPIKLIIVFITGSIAFGSILLMLFSPLPLIEMITSYLSHTIDIISLILLIALAIGYLIYLYRSRQAHQK